MEDGTYKIRGHIVKIENGVRVSADATTVMGNTKNIYSGNEYLHQHLNSLVQIDKKSTNTLNKRFNALKNEDKSTMKNTENDNIVANSTRREKEQISKNKEKDIQDNDGNNVATESSSQIKISLVNDVNNNYIKPEGFTNTEFYDCSGCRTECNSSNLNKQWPAEVSSGQNVKSIVKNILSIPSTPSRKVTFSNSIEFDDGNSIPLIYIPETTKSGLRDKNSSGDLNTSIDFYKTSTPKFEKNKDLKEPIKNGVTKISSKKHFNVNVVENKSIPQDSSNSENQKEFKPDHNVNASYTIDINDSLENTPIVKDSLQEQVHIPSQSLSMNNSFGVTRNYNLDKKNNLIRSSRRSTAEYIEIDDDQTSSSETSLYKNVDSHEREFDVEHGIKQIQKQNANVEQAPRNAINTIKLGNRFPNQNCPVSSINNIESEHKEDDLTNKQCLVDYNSGHNKDSNIIKNKYMNSDSIKKTGDSESDSASVCENRLRSMVQDNPINQSSKYFLASKSEEDPVFNQIETNFASIALKKAEQNYTLNDKSEGFISNSLVQAQVPTKPFHRGRIIVSANSKTRSKLSLFQPHPPMRDKITPKGIQRKGADLSSFDCQANEIGKNIGSQYSQKETSSILSSSSSGNLMSVMQITMAGYSSSPKEVWAPSTYERSIDASFSSNVIGKNYNSLTAHVKYHLTNNISNLHKNNYMSQNKAGQSVQLSHNQTRCNVQPFIPFMKNQIPNIRLPCKNLSSNQLLDRLLKDNHASQNPTSVQLIPFQPSLQCMFEQNIEPKAPIKLISVTDNQTKISCVSESHKQRNLFGKSNTKALNIDLNKTPNDNEINELWQNVRDCSNSAKLERAFSDTAVLNRRYSNCRNPTTQQRPVSSVKRIIVNKSSNKTKLLQKQKIENLQNVPTHTHNRLYQHYGNQEYGAPKQIGNFCFSRNSEEKNLKTGM